MSILSSGDEHVLRSSSIFSRRYQAGLLQSLRRPEPLSDVTGGIHVVYHRISRSRSRLALTKSLELLAQRALDHLGNCLTTHTPLYHFGVPPRGAGWDAFTASRDSVLEYRGWTWGGRERANCSQVACAWQSSCV